MNKPRCLAGKHTAPMILAVLLLATPAVLPAAEPKADDPVAHCAVSTRPLTNWTSGFLTGNGNMGVIMGGEPYAETLIINGKLYLPLGSKEILPDLSAFKDEFKQAGLAAGKDGPGKVHGLMWQKCRQKLVDTDPLHPAFLLRLPMKGTPGAARNYRMTEDFTTGELQVRWSDEQGDWCRKLFVSRPDDVIVMSIQGPKGKVDCDVAMEVQHPLVKSDFTVEDGWIAAHNTYLQGKGGYDNLIRVIPVGGRMQSSHHAPRDASGGEQPRAEREDYPGLSITGADSILLVMQVKKWKTPLPKEQSEAWAFSPEHPDFRGAYPTNRLAEMRQSLARLRPDYAQLFAPHVRAHGALYHRVGLDLGGGDERRLTSEELLARAGKDGTMSKALAERLYNACRYLIICCSGDTPPNLQGIWTGTWKPAWSGDYTLDSNLQLEIQSMMSCNMPELMKSYFNLVDSWVPDWRLNAKKIYGFRGVASDVRASSVCLLQRWGGWPGEQAAIGIAGWLLHFYYDYYQFTGDRKFLAERFVPLAKEIALFYEDFLAGTEDANGKYRFYMGYSPEHRLIANTTYDIAIAKNVLTTLIAASRELGIESDNVPRWQTMLGKMPPYLINDAGELQEWSWPGATEDANHRHHSHFLPLYQFCEFDRDTTPALWKAAGLAFDQKVQQWLRGPKPGSNNTTHGMMNQGQCAARLGRSDVVYEVLSRMITRRYLHPSFMMGYWPRESGFGFDPAGAIPDVLNNALIFAWNGTIDVLPALPKEWPTGSIGGVLLRGQIQVQQLAWDIPARKISLTLVSGKDQAVTLRFPPGLHVPANCRKLALTKGQPVHVEIAIAETETTRTLSADEARVNEAMRQRSLVSAGDPARIQAVLAKARRGEPICVAAIGGSITAGGIATKDPARRYVQQLGKWFEEVFPGLKVRVVNAGIGATNSGYGALRVQRDVIAHQPDLVVVEYAVNDCTGMGKLDESYEGVLRQLLGSSTNRAVIELFFMHKDGKNAQPEQVALGRHYGLPMISFRDAVWPELQAGTIKWETIYADVVHPNDAGHDIASELLRGLLSASLDKLPKNDRDLPALAPVPAPLISDTFARCTMFRAADLKPLSAAGWTCVKSNVWECGRAGGRLEYEVGGTVLMLGRTIPEVASNCVELVVDGGTPRPILRDGHNRLVAKGLNPGMHRVAVAVHPFGGGETENADKVQIWWGGAAGL